MTSQQASKSKVWTKNTKSSRLKKNSPTKNPQIEKFQKKSSKLYVVGFWWAKIGVKKCVKLFKKKFEIRWLIKSPFGIDLTASFHIKSMNEKYKIFSSEKKSPTKNPQIEKFQKKSSKLYVVGFWWAKIGVKKCVKLFKNKFEIKWLIKSPFGIDLTASFQIKSMNEKYKIFSSEKKLSNKKPANRKISKKVVQIICCWVLMGQNWS